MRKFFFCFGIVMAVVVGLASVGFAMLLRNGARLDAESRAYVEDTIVTVASHWDAAALWKRSTSRFRATSTEDELRAFFSAANDGLGPLVQYRGATGQATIAVTNAGSTTTANYDAKATFEKGDAEIVIAAVKTGNTWRIEGFHVNSPALMRRLVGVRS